MKQFRRIFSAVPALVLFCIFTSAAFAETLYLYDSEVIPEGSMHAIAHRGYSAIAPENTLPAYRLAGEYGFWGAECDISQTADGVWVLMHDKTVDRMTDGEGEVNELTYAEICEMTVDAGNNIGQFPGTKVPTLSEYLDVCKEYGMHPVIEIKEIVLPEQLPDLAAILNAREEKERFIIISWGRELIAEMESLAPAFPTYLIGGPATTDDVAFCIENGIDGIDFSGNSPADVVRAAQDADLKTAVWTVDSLPLAERFFQMGVTDITTNALVPGKTPCGHISGAPVKENEVPAACTERGSFDTVTYCTVCGNEVSRNTVYTDPTGHAWGEWTVVREATVEEEGLRQRVCANDPSHVETDPIPKLTPPADNGGSGKSLWQTIMEFFQRIADFFRRLFRI